MKRISWGKAVDNMIKDNIALYGFNPGIRKSVMHINKVVHNNYRRRNKFSYTLTTTESGKSIITKEQA